MTSTLGIKKIQHPNGTNIATLDSSGSIAFAGASTVAGTLGVTGAITGTLATAAQTNITSVGTLTSFRSTGIDDNADALALTIDNSENVLIGKTTTALATAGLTLGSSGFASLTRSGAEPLSLNRLSSDGSVAVFYKDGTSVGSIFSGHGGSQVGIGTNTTGITFNGATRSMMPADPTSTAPQLDATLDIGFSSVRWRNLYLSSGVFLGGTGSSNQLDDYEEGTWTPTLTDGSGNDGTVNSGSTGGTYTKIGRMVAITGRCTTTSVSGLSSLTYVKNLPFAAISGQAGYATLAVSQAFNLNITAGQSVELTISPGDTKAAVRLNDHGAGNTAMSPSQWSDDGYVMFSGVYVTT